jgi:hypothetical protein
MKKKVKRYQDGGMTYQDAPMQNTNPQAPSASSGYFSNTASSYPFQSSSSAPSAPATTDTGSGVNQTFNIQPSAQAGQPTGMKRGGRVTSASKRADGCAIRGKTRA